MIRSLPRMRNYRLLSLELLISFRCHWRFQLAVTRNYTIDIFIILWIHCGTIINALLQILLEVVPFSLCTVSDPRLMKTVISIINNHCELLLLFQDLPG